MRKTLIFILFTLFIHLCFAGGEQAIDQVTENKIRIENIEKQQDKLTDRIDESTEQQREYTDKEIKEEIDIFLDDRNDILKMREKNVDWMFSFLSIFIAFIGILLPLIILIANYKLSKRIEKQTDEAVKSAKEKVEFYVDIAKMKSIEAEKYADEAKNKYNELNYIKANDDIENNVELFDEISKDNTATALDKEIANAYQLQEKGNLSEAIETWENILHNYDIDKIQKFTVYFNIAYLNYKVAKKESNQNMKKELINKVVLNLNKALEIDSGSIESYFNRSLAYIELNDYNSALRDLNKAIELNPDYSDAYLNRGNIKALLNEKESALSDYNKCLELKPNDVDCYFSRAAVYMELKQYNKAISDYSIGLGITENHIAYSNRGIAYSEIQDYEKALKDFDASIRLYPNDSISYSARGSVKMDLKDYESALNDFNQAINTGPDNFVSYAARGHLYIILRRYNDAVKDLNSALELKPNDYMSLHNRGVAQERLKENEKAIEDYTSAIKINNKFNLSYLNRGRTYSNEREFTKALLDINKAIELDPMNIEGYLQRGLAKTRMKDFAGAINDYHFALKVNPNYIPVLLNLIELSVITKNETSFDEYVQKLIKLDIKNNDRFIIDYLTEIGNITFGLSEKINIKELNLLFQKRTFDEIEFNWEISEITNWLKEERGIDKENKKYILDLTKLFNDIIVNHNSNIEL